MRPGGFIAAVAAPLLLGSCALPVKACADAVNVYFSRGFDQINLDALDKVLLAVSTLNACPAARAVVSGHIDGTELATPALGQARAANVTAVMVKNGIAPARITVRNEGFARPARPTAPGIAEPKNRFVAIEWS
jgi:outer membrane protein OmpA-like peptidoglycan-associated protein